ncbi:hypothetical protein [Flavobacterium sp.]|jgi:hypothetical protein|uniref:hypothetical protein n=1 Tax=Flavobacterium sp. TaxID=239 RepID=UPI0037C0304D
MKTKYLKAPICVILKNSFFLILIFSILSCKKDKQNNANINLKLNSSKTEECEINKKITTNDSLNEFIKMSFSKSANNTELYPITKKGRLNWNFGKKIVCNFIEKENLTSSVVYYMGNDYYREISELHFKKGFSQKSFNKLKSELIRRSNKNKLNHEEEDEFFDFMKTGLVFLLDFKNDTIIIIEYNIFINPKNHKEIMKFIELNKNNYDGILVSEGYPKIKIIK